MSLETEFEALKAWVRELFTHSGAHHSMVAPPVPLDPKPADKPAEEPAP